nr:uncharacterized protein LOC109191529 [Ipomoea trifida]
MTKRKGSKRKAIDEGNTSTSKEPRTSTAEPGQEQLEEQPTEEAQQPQQEQIEEEQPAQAEEVDSPEETDAEDNTTKADDDGLKITDAEDNTTKADDDGLKIRALPKILTTAVEQLNPAQRQVVKDIGLGSLLDLQITNFPRQMGLCRAKWRLNHGSAASTSSIFLFNAFGVIYAVVFSKNHLHSFNISGIAFTVLFVISIFPFGRPRTAATSSAVIWIVCPFWSFNVQLLGSKFSTNHSPIWRGKLVICRSRRLPNPMSFTTWRCAGFSCSTAVVSIFGSALISSPSSSAFVVLSSASVSSGLSTSSAWAGCSSSICSCWGCCASSVGCSSSCSCPGSAVDVRGSLLVDVFPSSIAFRLLPA